jgi:hypothetical protein
MRRGPAQRRQARGDRLGHRGIAEHLDDARGQEVRAARAHAVHVGQRDGRQAPEGQLHAHLVALLQRAVEAVDARPRLFRRQLAHRIGVALHDGEEAEHAEGSVVVAAGLHRGLPIRRLVPRPHAQRVLARGDLEERREQFLEDSLVYADRIATVVHGGDTNEEVGAVEPPAGLLWSPA